MGNDDYDEKLKLALEALLNCKDLDTIDLVYRLLAFDNNEGRA